MTSKWTPLLSRADSRGLAPALRAALADTPVVCLLGPRQCGKTTLARSLAPHYGYVTFDDEDTLNLAGSDPNGFLAALPDPVILDHAGTHLIPLGDPRFLAVPRTKPWEI